MNRVNLLIVEDHPLMRESLVDVFRRQPFINIIRTACNGQEAIAQIENELPDIVLLDIEMPIMEAIHRKWPNIKVMVLSQFSEKRLVKRMFLNGARGYLLKSRTASEILEAFQEVAFENEVVRDSKIDEHSSNGKINLWEREVDVLKLVCEQHSSKQIASILGISKNTVDNYRKSLLKKVGVHNSAGLVKWAFLNDVI